MNNSDTFINDYRRRLNLPLLKHFQDTKQFVLKITSGVGKVVLPNGWKEVKVALRQGKTI